MEEIKVKNFRCVKRKSGDYRVYFSLNGEERWIGYYNGYISGNEEIDEKSLTGSKVCDYTDIINKWNISDTRTVYKVNIYEAYRMDEEGIRYMFQKPKDTLYYKHEILGNKDFRFPDWKDGEIVTDDDCTFSYVSSEGIKTFKFEEQ